MMLAGERQVAPKLGGIRRDHTARYYWAVRQLSEDQALHPNQAGDSTHVLDVGCGVGYGSKIIANAGYLVVGVDKDADALKYAGKHYSSSNIVHLHGDIVTGVGCGGLTFDAAVCFEVIEHLEDPLPMLRSLTKIAPKLLASVPNELVMPFGDGYKFHYRHYTPGQFNDLLREAGWMVTSWSCQLGQHSDVTNGTEGRTLVVTAERAPPPDNVVQLVARTCGECMGCSSPEACKRDGCWIARQGLGSASTQDEQPATPPVLKAAPASVVILGLGPSLECYVDVAKRMGGRHMLGDEVWGINAVGNVIACDRIFHMDDVRIQEIRAAAKPQSNIANMLKWLKTTRIPVMTSRVHPEYPCLVEFPLEEVVNKVRFGYFNSTAAYAVAYAIYLGVKKISLFGCDYTYENSHQSEKGRGCLEFWLGFAAGIHNVEIALPPSTSLMDACEKCDRRYYGYDAVEIHRKRGDDGRLRFSFIDKPQLPTAESIEKLYDHAAHANPLMQEE